MKQDWWQGQSRFGMRPGLERIRALLDQLDHPECAYPTVHVAGTNGKGSVSAMLTEVLMSQGFTVGLYVSPDLGQVNERVMINRIPLDEVQWDRYAAEIESAGQGLADVPTWFETITALAFLAFSRQSVDIAVVEVGMGGRLDATNVIPPPLLAVVTPVAFDHTGFLGGTIEAIAKEKAGIIKPGSELVLAAQPYAKARDQIFKVAEAHEVPVHEAKTRAVLTADGPELRRESGAAVRIPLKGAYQANNLDTVWTAVERLDALGWVTDVERARRSLQTVRWPGRFEVISEAPLVVVDGAHNPHGMKGLADTLRSAPWDDRHWHLVFGVLADKSAAEMLNVIVSQVDSIILTRVPGERGRDPKTLLKDIDPEKPVRVVDEPSQALEEALSALHHPQDAVLVTGSLALLSYLRQSPEVQFSPKTGVDMRRTN